MTHIFEFKFQSLYVVCDFIARLKSQMRAQPDKKHTVLKISMFADLFFFLNILPYTLTDTLGRYTLYTPKF